MTSETILEEIDWARRWKGSRCLECGQPCDGGDCGRQNGERDGEGFQVFGQKD